MPTFNNINYTMTERQQFSLFCGMLAGLRIGNPQYSPVTPPEPDPPTPPTPPTPLCYEGHKAVYMSGFSSVEDFRVSVPDVEYIGQTIEANLTGVLEAVFESND